MRLLFITKNQSVSFTSFFEPIFKMNKFEKNITNSYGQAGISWLISLSNIIESSCKKWNLSNVNPVEIMNWNFVALAMKNSNLPVILKISYNKELILDEYSALSHFDGDGAIRVHDIDTESNALLLERAIPGYSLKNSHFLEIEEKINIYTDVVKKLIRKKLPDRNHVHVKDWCSVIDRITDPRISKSFLAKAIKLRSALLSNIQHEYLCHGDLHLENILQTRSSWVAIDPKGIIGEIAFEASAFDLISEDEMNDVSSISTIIDRLTRIATRLEISYVRLISWVFLRVVISAQWFVEDNGDPAKMLGLAEHIYPLIDPRMHK